MNGLCLGSVSENCLQGAEVILLQLFLDCQPLCPPFLDADLGWLSALFTQQWREKPYFLLYTLVSFLPFFKYDVCREKAPGGGAPLFQPWSVLVCKDWSNWSRLGGAHTLHVIFEECAMMWVWRERVGPPHFLLVLQRETCSVSGSGFSSVWILKTKLNRNQLLRVVIYSCHLVTFFTICQCNCYIPDKIILCSAELLASDLSLIVFPVGLFNTHSWVLRTN